jgi:PLP dependent protein
MLSAPQNSAPVTELATRLQLLHQRIAAAANAARRDVECITLLAASKGQAVAQIQQAMSLGLTQFGENYVAEALPKIQALRESIATWHFIGRLQANKTRDVASHFDWVHGLDRLKLAERLSEQRNLQAQALNVCIQVNVMGEASKGGVSPELLPPLLQAVSVLPRLRLRGLMCMLPYELDSAGQHLAFARMRALLESARDSGLMLDTLSMGMSADMDAAVAEGATLLRIGTALFGPRS